MDKQSVKEQIKKLIIREKPNIFFIHIPKTGGTSVNFALTKIYKKNSYHVNSVFSQKAAKILYELDDYTDYTRVGKPKFRFREHLAIYEMVKGTQYISGYVNFNLDIWIRKTELNRNRADKLVKIKTFLNNKACCYEFPLT